MSWLTSFHIFERNGQVGLEVWETDMQAVVLVIMHQFLQQQ